MTTVTVDDIRRAVREAGLAGKCVEAHASLRSFGRVEGGAPAVVRAFLDEGCTLLVPTFSYSFMLHSQPGMRPERNAWQYETDWDRSPSGAEDKVYSPDCSEIAEDMGAVPEAVLAMPGRVRGRHPLWSFSAIGPRAAELFSAEGPMNGLAPAEASAAGGGMVALMGVGWNRLTLLHLAEKLAGRTMFRRWANGPDGRPIMTDFGGCSEGFVKFEPVLAPLSTRLRVGASEWTALSAAECLGAAVEAIRRDGEITRCGRLGCERCRDGVSGGPLFCG